MLVKGFDQFGGKYCETASLMKTLAFHELPLSEETFLGLGGDVGFIYWYTKMMPTPFIGTRYGKDENLLTTTCRRIGAKATTSETMSSTKALDELKRTLKANEPAICYGDMAYLPYFAVPEAAHFGAHVFIVFGLDEKRNMVYISDRAKRAVDNYRRRSSKSPWIKVSSFPAQAQIAEDRVSFKD